MCLAVPGQIRDVRGEDLERAGRVAFGGVLREVSLALVPEADVGDYVVVHAGIAIARMDETAALKTLEEIAALEETDLACGSAER